MTAQTLIFSIFLLFTGEARAGVPTDSLQLQQLIAKSEQQVEILKKILAQENMDASALNQAATILENLSAGIRQSIEPYQGTAEYKKAAQDLLSLQAADDYRGTHSDSKDVRDSALKSGDRESSEKDFNDLIRFQKATVQANQAELIQQSKLQDALKTAGPGFVPKISAEAQIGAWQSTERLSTQLTQLLAINRAIREELRAMRANGNRPGWLSQLFQGVEAQDERLRSLK